MPCVGVSLGPQVCSARSEHRRVIFRGGWGWPHLYLADSRLRPYTYRIYCKKTTQTITGKRAEVTSRRDRTADAEDETEEERISEAKDGDEGELPQAAGAPARKWSGTPAGGGNLIGGTRIHLLSTRSPRGKSIQAQKGRGDRGGREA